MADKAALVEELNRTQGHGMDALTRLDPNAVIYTESGWTVKDLIAHLAAWDEAGVLCFEAYADGGSYRIPDYVHYDTFNWQQYEKRKDLPVHEVYASWDRARTRIREIVERLTPEQLEGQIMYPAGNYNTCATLIREVWEHQEEHFKHIFEVVGGSYD
jgi:hypothetical protein